MYFFGMVPCEQQDAQDGFLEQQRELSLTHKILVIQNAVRSWHYRRRFLRMRKNIVILQTCWRAFAERSHFIKVRKIEQRNNSLIYL